MTIYFPLDEESVNLCQQNLNKTIKELNLTDYELHMTFDDNSKIIFFDDGQSCCEHRYFTCDDELSEFIGAKFIGAEIKTAPNIPTDGEEHEINFLDIQTDRGVFQITAHNEHNGYYGGFIIRIR